MNPISLDKLFCQRHQYRLSLYSAHLSSCQRPNKYKRAGIRQSLYSFRYCWIWAFFIL